ncbi:MAG: alanine racemase, partial [Cryomorphaceae bacterium]|nr:alanine racemase [Cryomorphaceae bacterium]
RVYHAAKHHPDILIMGDIASDAMDWVVQHHIGFFCFSIDRLQDALNAAKNTGIPARVHLEVETGLNRTGLNESELKKALNLIIKNPDHLKLEGLCSHLAGAESIANYLRIKKQRSMFKRMDEIVRAAGFDNYCRHLACSAALVRYADTRMDMVRVGIMQYGFWPSPEIFIEYCGGRALRTSPLKRVISWKTRVMSVKKVKTGEYIGYGTSYIAHQDMSIAVLPVGYSHGFFRSLSNKGRVLVNGERVPVVGIVNMNGTTVDISGVNDVKLGDEVVIIGIQGDLEITVASFGEYSNQLNYELLTRLPEHIPRHVVE